MLLFEDSLGQTLLGIPLKYRDRRLSDDGPMVHLFVDEVNGRPGDPGAVLEGLALRVQAGERREQCGMNIEYSTGKRLQEHASDDAVETGKRDGVDIERLKGIANRGVEMLAVSIFCMGEDPGRNAMVGGESEATGIRPVAENDTGACLQSVFGDGGEDSSEIGPAS